MSKFFLLKTKKICCESLKFHQYNIDNEIEKNSGFYYYFYFFMKRLDRKKRL